MENRGYTMSEISTLTERIAALKAETPELEEGWALITVVCGNEEDRLLIPMAEDSCYDLLALGATYREKGRKADMLILASHIWASVYSEMEPCDDPNRKDGTVIVALARDGIGRGAARIGYDEWQEGP